MTFENWHTVRARAQNSLFFYWDSLTDSLAKVTLAKAALLGTTVAVGAASIITAPALLDDMERRIVLKVANSDQFADREEACALIGNPGQVNPKLLCSPHFDKGRKPGGKLITSRLATFVPPPSLPIQQYHTLEVPTFNQTADEEILQADPEVMGPREIQDARYHLPTQAPDNLRELRFGSPSPSPTSATKIPNRSSAPKSGRVRYTKVSQLPPHMKCKRRSYWSVAHQECRRKR